MHEEQVVQDFFRLHPQNEKDYFENGGGGHSGYMFTSYLYLLTLTIP